MKRLTIVLAIVAVAAVPVFADAISGGSSGCYGAAFLDTPPCVPCPYLWSAWWWGEFDYPDGSALFVSGDVLANCDGDHQYTTIASSYWCPNGPDDEQCVARQRYFSKP